MRAAAPLSPEIRILLAARGIRALADGLVSLVLPVYLLALGYGAVEAGLIATATLSGSALLTLGIGLVAHRAPARALLLGVSALMILTGLAFASLSAFWPLVLVSFVGTLNPSGGDVSAFLPLEQARLAGAGGMVDRTRLFARYSFVGAIGAAIGALGAGLLDAAVALAGMEFTTACQAVFGLYALAGAGVLLLYARLPDAEPGPGEARVPLGPSRGVVVRLAALFSLDSFAGGFVVQSLLALWLLERFDLSLAAAGKIFFWTGLLSALSYFVAARLSERIGLVNTMVFTHLPANLCLLLVPFAPDLWSALALLLVRSALAQMDVPTRTAFVMQVVTPGERAA
ncbi:MAG TPA: MFS transporter, partial [Salinarimonas sp.]|nr:MFS transporter [Salinarimonas sp.]